jgi:alpha-mannosidase
MYFTVEKIEKLIKEIRPRIYRQVYEIPQFKFHQGSCSGAECPEFDDRYWDDFKVGDYWGGYDILAWFRAWVAIPSHFKDKKVALRFLVGPRDGGGSTAETLLYVNGTPMQAVDVWHEEVWLPPEFLQQDEILVALKAWSGVLEVPDRRRFKLAHLIWIDEETERYYHQAETLLKSIRLLDESDLRRTRLLNLLNGSFRCIDFIKPGSEAFYRSVALAGELLSDGLAGLESLEIKPRVTGIGQAHIDMAWLWRLSHTREKAARTFATALHLMRQYPEYRFVHSSPQLYKHLKEDYPEIFARVKEKIAAGSWEITGGMWIEADTNLPGGESLIRQFLLGRQFIRDEFGLETNTLWLPDVFGYSGSLPQIARKSGMKYFMTTKISWSQFNRFPYDTFYWRGIDGTELLTHFVTTPDSGAWFYTYNGKLEPSEVKGIWDQYRQKDANDELLLLYGWGDGGGGPTKGDAGISPGHEEPARPARGRAGKGGRFLPAARRAPEWCGPAGMGW